MYHNLSREAAQLSEALLNFYQTTFCIRTEDFHRFQSRIVAAARGVSNVLDGITTISAARFCLNTSVLSKFFIYQLMHNRVALKEY
jgi:hypothetical protein